LRATLEKKSRIILSGVSAPSMAQPHRFRERVEPPRMAGVRSIKKQESPGFGRGECQRFRALYRCLVNGDAHRAVIVAAYYC
jgi:hypothetical protein